jgi:hypothetical protein
VSDGDHPVELEPRDEVWDIVGEHTDRIRPQRFIAFAVTTQI